MASRSSTDPIIVNIITVAMMFSALKNINHSPFQKLDDNYTRTKPSTFAFKFRTNSKALQEKLQSGLLLSEIVMETFH